jgi:hypothetical protein
MLDRRIDMTQTLEKGAARTITFFKALPPADLDRPVYVDDVHWTVRQVLAHFITIEKSMRWLFRNMLTGGPGSPQDFDLERFNRTQPAKLDGLSLDELIERFGAVRKETIAIAILCRFLTVTLSRCQRQDAALRVQIHTEAAQVIQSQKTHTRLVRKVKDKGLDVVELPAVQFD